MKILQPTSKVHHDSLAIKAFWLISWILVRKAEFLVKILWKLFGLKMKDFFLKNWIVSTCFRSWKNTCFIEFEMCMLLNRGNQLWKEQTAETRISNHYTKRLLTNQVMVLSNISRILAPTPNHTWDALIVENTTKSQFKAIWGIMEELMV